MQYIRYLPKKLMSRWVGAFVKITRPRWLALTARNWFIKKYKINISEAEKPLHEYPSIGSLFIRKLKPGLRPLGDGLVHPCDSQLTTAGLLNEGTLIQTKGIRYSVNRFLNQENAHHVYHEGCFFTYYLCPTDYHRVHSPTDGDLYRVTHVPGELWPVNPWSVENIDQLFAVNERVIFDFHSQQGPWSLIMIGATNVGDIEVSLDSTIQTNCAGQKKPEVKNYSPVIKVKKGDELGIFHMGSSVVVIYSKGYIQSWPALGPVKMGQSLSPAVGAHID